LLERDQEEPYATTPKPISTRAAQTELRWCPLGNVDSGASAHLSDAGRATCGA
jgi:hypothetical protein